MNPEQDDGMKLRTGQIEHLQFGGAAGAVSIAVQAEPLEAGKSSIPSIALDSTSLADTLASQETLLDLAAGRSAADLRHLTEVLSKRSPSIAKTAAEGVVAARDAGDAAEGLVDSLKRDLEDGPLFVVWLLDASISLLDDRQSLARSLEPFYEEYAPRGAGDAPLRSAVVAYGHGFQVVQPATASRRQILNAIREMPIDPTGVENLMTALEFSVGHFRAAARDRMRVVVWTDESGDDPADAYPSSRHWPI
jgi:hypothetical protein